MEKKVAIVTGASRGIGKAIAEEFAFRRYRLGLISRNKEEIERISDYIREKYDIGCLGFECDVSNKNRVLEVFCNVNEEFGGLDVLINNAGINSRRSLKFLDVKKWFDDFDFNFDGWNDEIRVNLTGVFICSYFGAGFMLNNGVGSIVNISSIKGKEATSSPGYGASKAGVIKLTRDFAKSLAGSGVRVNCIAPGFIDTGMTSELSDEKKKMYKSMIPMGRFGGVDEIAKAAVYFASEDSGYITGETLNVNGGYLMD